MKEEPREEHRWLEKLVGEWTYEGECIMGPDQPPMKMSGVETVRSLGGLWTIGEGENTGPDGGGGKTVMTIGFDPKSGRYVGTFVASAMSHLWTYDGAIEGDVLALDADGPSFTGGGTTKYRDTIEFSDADHRTLKSHARGEDGKWVHFMTAHYTRRK
jgi:hypothetical protein